MQLLCVNGPCRLIGEMTVSGAKNAVLPILAASVLCREPVTLHHCPDLTDVSFTLAMLRECGCRIQRRGASVRIDASELSSGCLRCEHAGKMRASVLLLGALLARTQCADISMPGGCPLGKRPIDLHLTALRRLGAEISLYADRISAKCTRFRGCELSLPMPSVGATEHILLAAATAEGDTVLHGAALEPEIDDLIGFLNACGAKIRRRDRTVFIEGAERLHGASYTVMPDRMEAATFLCAAAGCGGTIVLHNAKASQLQPILSALDRAGCETAAQGGEILLRAERPLLAPERIETAPYPGFPTDAQAVMMAALLRAEGRTVFRETVFENRFLHVPQLQRLGARLYQQGDTVISEGGSRLRACNLSAHDLRGAAALTIAAMQTEGRCLILGAEHLRRGYESFPEKLNALGCRVQYEMLPQREYVISR